MLNYGLITRCFQKAVCPIFVGFNLDFICTLNGAKIVSGFKRKGKNIIYFVTHARRVWG